LVHADFAPSIRILTLDPVVPVALIGTGVGPGSVVTAAPIDTETAYPSAILDTLPRPHDDARTPDCGRHHGRCCLAAEPGPRERAPERFFRLAKQRSLVSRAFWIGALAWSTANGRLAV
jgi:hypothetical protein